MTEFPSKLFKNVMLLNRQPTKGHSPGLISNTPVTSKSDTFLVIK